jgi:O-antigen/teichoic acid export membrane protein
VAAIDWLLGVGSMGESIGLYVSAKTLQKTIGLVRVLVFTWLLSGVQYGLWGLGFLVVTVATPLLTLGSNLGLERYVSYYEARGRLGAFYRQVRWTTLGVILALWAAAMAGSESITRALLVSPGEAPDVPFDAQLQVCWLALANALVGAVYLNLVSFLYGLRAYRAVGVIEGVFAGLFTLVAIAGLWVRPIAQVALLAHLGILSVCLGGGVVLLHAAVGRLGEAPEEEQEDDDEALTGAYGRIVRFGLKAMWGTFFWQWAGLISFWLISRQIGKGPGGVFHALMILAGVVASLAEAAWSAVYTHVARLWEEGLVEEGLAELQTAYKAIALAMMTLTLAVYGSAPLWVLLLPDRFQVGQDYGGGVFSNLLGGALLFFQTIIHMALMTILAKLHEKPALITLAAATGAAANVILALQWMPEHGAAGAAWAAGVGMLVGGGSVSVAFFLRWGRDLSPSCYGVFAAPVLLLLPTWASAVVWTAVLILAARTRWVFQRGEKQQLLRGLRTVKGLAVRLTRSTPEGGDRAGGPPVT